MSDDNPKESKMDATETIMAAFHNALNMSNDYVKTASDRYEHRTLPLAVELGSSHSEVSVRFNATNRAAGDQPGTRNVVYLGGGRYNVASTYGYMKWFTRRVIRAQKAAATRLAVAQRAERPLTEFANRPKYDMYGILIVDEATS